MNELPVIIPAYQSQSPGVSWPTESWPRGTSISAVDHIIDQAFTLDELTITNAVIVVQHGRIVAERYGGAKEFFDREPEPITAATSLISWSMAKSMLHCVVGLLVDEGRLDPAKRAGVTEWANDDDPRHAITLADLLAMRDGLDYVEEYVEGAKSDVIEMLFGSGKSDVAGYTVARPLRHPPNTVFNYSSGTTNVLSRLVADQVGYGDAYREFLQRRLFDPLGMATAVPTLDDTGVFIASSFVHATAQDFARFGLLYLRGGHWNGQQLVSTSWTDTAQIPRSRDPEDGALYSWQWWPLGDDYGTYCALGYDGQMIVISPALDTIVVRLGRTPADRNIPLREWRARLLDALAN